MKKEIVLQYLAYSCFLLPGNIKSRKRWWFSPLSILSLVTILFVSQGLVYEFIGYNQFVHDKRVREALTRLTYLPTRPIRFCLKSFGDNETLVEIKDENGVSIEKVEIKQNGSIHFAASSHRHPLSDLHDIVSTAYRLLIFVVNLVIRLFLWFSFPSLIDQLTSLFLPSTQQPQQPGGEVHDNNGFMGLIWYQATQKWSTGEKVFLLVIILSQLQREMEFFVQYYTSIRNTGIELLIVPCLVVQVIFEQSKVLLSSGFAMEIVSFFLIILMRTFVTILNAMADEKIYNSIISGSDEDSGSEFNVEDTSAFYGKEIGNGKHFGKLDKQTNDVIFVTPQAMAMKARGMEKVDRGIGSIDEHISGIIGSTHLNLHNKESTVRAAWTIKKKQIDGNFGAQNGGDAYSSTEEIYSKINFAISTYFDLMAVWEKASWFTGVITLLLFCELTTTFCFNTYITLDTTMKFGLFSGFGVTGLVKGVILITKLVCVCNAAQTLRDMTPILLDYILKLKLTLLSLPAEVYQGKVHSSMNLPFILGRKAVSQCERCRGLGSFLSEMVSYIRAHPFELTALGYFTVSRSTLTTITGVIVTYLVVLVQFQAYASTSPA